VSSGVDILVVSDEFRGMRHADRVAAIKLKLPEDISFKMIALTPEEFARFKKKAFYREPSTG